MVSHPLTLMAVSAERIPASKTPNIRSAMFPGMRGKSTIGSGAMLNGSGSILSLAKLWRMRTLRNPQVCSTPHHHELCVVDDISEDCDLAATSCSRASKLQLLVDDSKLRLDAFRHSASAHLAHRRSTSQAPREHAEDAELLGAIDAMIEGWKAEERDEEAERALNLACSSLMRFPCSQGLQARLAENNTDLTPQGLACLKVCKQGLPCPKAGKNESLARKACLEYDESRAALLSVETCESNLLPENATVTARLPTATNATIPSDDLCKGLPEVQQEPKRSNNPAGSCSSQRVTCLSPIRRPFSLPSTSSWTLWFLLSGAVHTDKSCGVSFSVGKGNQGV